MKELSQLRQEIDHLDAQILKLFSDRARVAQEVGELKKALDGANAVFYRPERERQVLERVAELNQGPLPNQEVQRLFRELMSACLALEFPLQIAYLGPVGTFTQMATYKQFGHSVNAHPKRSIIDVFKAVETGACDFGVVPVENSTEGVITHTLDNFIQTKLSICAEVQLRIEQNLLTHALDLNEIETVYSHSQSLAQCREWLMENLPHANIIATTSNAEATKMAMNNAKVAAIGGKMAGETYQVPIRFSNIEDDPNNTTRFLVIGRQRSNPTGNDKTSIMIASQNRAGSLYELIEPIQRHGLNMTRIESRPSRQALWEYIFFIDLEGHERDPKMEALFKELEAKSQVFRVLGSYPIGT